MKADFPRWNGLSSACLYLQDGLIQQCGETMKETINVKTVCGYYTSAGTYGLDSVKKKWVAFPIFSPSHFWEFGCFVVLRECNKELVGERIEW